MSLESLDENQMKVFLEVCQKPIQQQCVFFLNSFWNECQDQAEFIYSVATPMFRLADMHAKNIEYLHQYTDGSHLDLDNSLYFFQQMSKFFEAPENFSKNFGPWVSAHSDFASTFARSAPSVSLNVMGFKKDVKGKLDVNNDGQISLLKLLLFQYKLSAKEMVARYLKKDDEPEEIVKARTSLEEVNNAIEIYETEKLRLTEESQLPGIKGKRAINELDQLTTGQLMSTLNQIMISAQAEVRSAVKKFGKTTESEGDNEGALWWMGREIKDKKDKYSKK